MNKYSDIIIKLNDSTKIDLICQSNYDSSNIDKTNLTSFKFVFDTSINKYLISLNDSFISGAITNELVSNDDIYTLSLNSLKCDDEFLKIHFASLYFNSLNKCGFNTCFYVHNGNSIDIKLELKNEIEVIKRSRPKFVMTTKFISLGDFNNLTGINNNLILHSDDIEEIVLAINNGYSYIITSDDVKEELVKILNNTSESNLKIDENALNNMLKDRFDMLNNETPSNTRYPDFRGSALNELSILYKNDKSLLPIKDDKEIVLIGQAAKNETFNVADKAFEYNLNTKYYLHGYSYEDVDNTYLVKDALNKTEDKISVVYVKADDNGCIGPNELYLLNELHSNIRDVVVVSLGQIKDYKIFDLCDALISVSSIEAFGKPTFDILRGIDACGAKTLCQIYDEENKTLKPAYLGVQEGNVSINNLNLKRNSVEFVVQNESDLCVEPTFFLQYGDKILGFAKTKLLKKEYKTLSIELDTDIFLKYDLTTGEYVRENKEFELILTDFDKVSEGIKLSFDDTSINSRVIALNSKTNAKTKKFKRAKFIIATIVCIYIDVMLALVSQSDISESGQIVVLSAIGFVTFVYLIILIKFIVSLCKKPKKQIIRKDELDISALANAEKTCDIIYKTKVSDKATVIKVDDTKEKNVEEQKVDVKETSNDESNKEPENNIVSDVDITNPNVSNLEFDDFEESTSLNDLEKEIENFERVENAKEIDIASISKKFSTFLLTKGITTKLSTIVSLFSAFGSDKFIVLKSNDLELEKQFVAYLQEFLENSSLSLDISKYDNFNDALNDEESSLLSFINNSIQIYDHLSCLYVTNVNNNLNNVLRPFIVQTLNNTNVSINVKDERINLPKNACFIISGNNFNEYSDLVFELDLDLANVLPEVKEISPISITLSSLQRLIQNHEKEIYISEEEFKKIDALYDALGNTSSLSNKSTIDFENIYVLLSLQDFDVKDAVDTLIRGRVMPQVKKSVLFKNNKTEVINTITKIFDETMYPKSVKYLYKDEEVTNNE